MENENLILRASQGDRQARDRLVRENTGLVWSVVRRFLGRGQEAEDLFQIGVIGLLKAIDRFEISYEVQFSTYAVPMITGEIKRFLRDDGLVKVSRTVKEQARKLYRLKEEIENSEGREPSLGELAERLEFSREEAFMAVAACSEVESIHRPIYESEGEGILLLDHIDSGEAFEENAVNHMALLQVVGQLSEREKQILYRRYFCGHNQAQIAKELGVSQVQVSRLLKKILNDLRKQLTE